MVPFWERRNFHSCLMSLNAIFLIFLIRAHIIQEDFADYSLATCKNAEWLSFIIRQSYTRAQKNKLFDVGDKFYACVDWDFNLESTSCLSYQNDLYNATNYPDHVKNGMLVNITVEMDRYEDTYYDIC